MNQEDKFFYDVANLKKDFEIENLTVTSADINMLKQLNNNEITMNEMINNIKESFINGAN